ncbi:MAG: glycosyltransferase family 39 protein [Candidatus Binatia bacterium]
MSRSPAAPPPPSPGDRLDARARRVGLALLIAALGCAALGQWQFGRGHAALGGQYEDFLAHRGAGLAWYGAAGLLMALLCAWTRRWALAPGRAARAAAAALLALFLVGAGLRFHRLAELPPGLWIDEGLNGVQAVEIAARGWPLVALPPEDVRTGLGAGFVDVAGLVFALFDPDDGPYALRALAAVIGLLGVVAAGGLAWALFGARAALAASAWLAVSHYHLNYSRWGEMPIMSPLIETLLCLAVWLGLRWRGWRAWAAWSAAGLLAGAGVYTYQTFRLFIVLAGVGGLLWAWRSRRALLRARWPQLAAAAVLAVLVATPMLHYAATQPEQFGERAQGTLILVRDDWAAQLAESVPRSLLAFQFVGDDNARHNLPFAPLLTFMPSMLAPLGLVICLCRWRRPAYALVPAWFAVALVPGMITLEAPHASRLLDTIVPLALMIGIAVDGIAGIVLATLPARPARAVLAVGLGAAALVAARQEYRAYFVARPRLPSYYDAFFPYESAPARYLAAHRPTETVFLDASTYWNPTTQFVGRRHLDDRPTDVRMLRLAHDFPPQGPLSRDLLYLLPRPYASLADGLRALSPAVACDEVRDPFGRVDLVACRVPRAAAVAVRDQLAAGVRPWPFGLRGRFYKEPDASGTPYHEAVLPFAFEESGLEAEPIGRFGAAVWDGFIDVPEDGEYLFRLHPDSTSLTIDGQPVIAHAGAAAFGGGHDGRVALRAGRRALRIDMRPGPQGPYFLWFQWEPPGRDAEWVPAMALHPPES